MKQKQKPLTLVCYLCGRQFGTLSLKIHLKTCKQKFQLRLRKQPNPSHFKCTKFGKQRPRSLLSCNRFFMADSKLLNNIMTMHSIFISIISYPLVLTVTELSMKIVCRYTKKCVLKYPNNLFSKKKQRWQIRQRKFLVLWYAVYVEDNLECVHLRFIIHSACKNQERKKKRKLNRKDGQLQFLMWPNQNKSTTKIIGTMNRLSHLMKRLLKNSKITPKYIVRDVIVGSCLSLTIITLRIAKTIICLSKKERLNHRLFEKSRCQKYQFAIFVACSSALVVFLSIKRLVRSNLQITKIKSLQVDVSHCQLFDLKYAVEWNQEKILQYNKIASEVYQKQGMHRCKFCLRTFKQQALQKHFSYCSNQQKRKQQSKEMEELLKDAQFLKKKRESQRIRVTKDIQYEETNICNVLELINKNYIKKEITQINAETHIQNKDSKPQNQLITNFDTAPKIQIMLTDLTQDQKQRQQILMTFNNNKITKMNNYTKQIEVVSQSKTQNEIKGGQLFQISVKQQQIELNEQNIQIQLINCQKCGRKFVAQRIMKHQNVCKGNQALKSFPKKLSNYKIYADKESKQINTQQLPKEVEKDIKKQNEKDIKIQKNALHKKNLKEIKKDIKQKQQQETPNTNIIQNINQQAGVFNQNNNNINSQFHNFKSEVKQNEEDAVFQSTKCKICNRNFRLDRIQVHQRICQNTRQNRIKMKVNLPKKKENDIKYIQKTQNFGKKTNPPLNRQQSKQKDQMGKTKFTAMLKQIKSRRVKDIDIDRELDFQLNKFKEQNAQAKENNWNYEQNKVTEIDFQMKERVKIQQDDVFEQAVVAKWKKKRRSGCLKQS